MKKILFLILALLITFSSAIAQSRSSTDVYVKGYTRKDGTYVQPHYRSAPNYTNRDNFSTKGNINPYTGKKGTVDPDNKYLNSNYSYSGGSNYGGYYEPSMIYYLPVSERKNNSGIAAGYFKSFTGFGEGSAVQLDIYLRKFLIGFKYSFDEIVEYDKGLIETQAWLMTFGNNIYKNLFYKIGAGYRFESIDEYLRTKIYGNIDLSFGLTYPIKISWFGIIPEIYITPNGSYGYGASIMF